MLLSFTFQITMLGILGLILILFVIYFILSHRGNRRLNKYASINQRNIQYTVRADFAKQKLYLYSRHGPGSGQEYNISEYINRMDLEEQSKWKKWINDILNDEYNHDEEQSITIALNAHTDDHTISDKTSDKSVPAKRYFRLILTSKNGENIFFSSIEIPTNVHSRMEKTKSLDLIDWDEFASKVSSFGRQVRGAIICLNCNLYNVVDKHYGHLVSEQLMHEIWKDVNSFNGHECIAGHYQDDSYLFFYPHIISQSVAEKKAKELLLEFNRPVSFDIHQFDLRPSIGITFMGAYSQDVMEVLKEASKAAEAARTTSDNQHIVFYNDEMAAETRKLKASYDELSTIISEKGFEPMYYPVFSLHTGAEVGYFCEIDFSKYEIKNFAEAYCLALQVGLETEFFNSIMTTLLNRFVDFVDKNSRRLFVFCDLKQLTELQELIISDLRYQRIELVAIITNYEDLIEMGDKTLQLLQQSRQCQMSLGLVANEDMQASIISALNYFNWLIIPTRMTKLLSSNEKMKIVIGNIVDMMERFNLNTVAWHVNNYAQAEILKSLGVSYIHGSILDSRQNEDSSSVRKVAKLIDEKE
jgi:EAL domain-containing protein (putative c-di-GMP-specific phosphodiesterase class I)/GGDEF domain-containing protein